MFQKKRNIDVNTEVNTEVDFFADITHLLQAE